MSAKYACRRYTADFEVLLSAGCRISRDERGRATDDTFIARLWRTVK